MANGGVMALFLTYCLLDNSQACVESQPRMATRNRGSCEDMELIIQENYGK